MHFKIFNKNSPQFSAKECSDKYQTSEVSVSPFLHLTYYILCETNNLLVIIYFYFTHRSFLKVKGYFDYLFKQP